MKSFFIYKFQIFMVFLSLCKIRISKMLRPDGIIGIYIYRIKYGTGVPYFLNFSWLIHSGFGPFFYSQ